MSYVPPKFHHSTPPRYLEYNVISIPISAPFVVWCCFTFAFALVFFCFFSSLSRPFRPHKGHTRSNFARSPECDRTQQRSDQRLGSRVCICSTCPPRFVFVQAAWYLDLQPPARQAGYLVREVSGDTCSLRRLGRSDRDNLLPAQLRGALPIFHTSYSAHPSGVSKVHM